MHLLVKHYRNPQQCIVHAVSRLYLLSFSSTGSAFTSSRTSLFLLWSNGVYQLFFWKISSQLDANHFLSLFLRAQISFPYKRVGTASALYTFILKNMIIVITFPSSMFLYFLPHHHFLLSYIKSLQFIFYLDSQTSRCVSILWWSPFSLIILLFVSKFWIYNSHQCFLICLNISHKI